MIRKEIILFLICLLISFILWMIHQLNQTYIREYNINTYITEIPKVYEQDSILFPIKIKVKGSGLKIVLLENYFPEKIDIPFKKLKKLNSKKLFLLDADNISDDKHFPVKIKIIEIEPDTIRINFKKKK